MHVVAKSRFSSPVHAASIVFLILARHAALISAGTDGIRLTMTARYSFAEMPMDSARGRSRPRWLEGLVMTGLLEGFVNPFLETILIVSHAGGLGGSDIDGNPY